MYFYGSSGGGIVVVAVVMTFCKGAVVIVVGVLAFSIQCVVKVGIKVQTFQMCQILHNLDFRWKIIYAKKSVQLVKLKFQQIA